MKVLFLDVDGVLNSLRSCLAMGGYGYMGNPDSWKQLDPVAIGILKRLVEETGCEVVLSSTWRLAATQEELDAFADFLQLGKKFYGVTPYTSCGHRGTQIDIWLKEHKEVYEYVIIDDDSDMLPKQKHRFVKTNHSNGLSYQDYANAYAILTAP